MDHIKPKTKGGTDKPNNLQWLCHRCNKLKGSTRTNDEVRELINNLLREDKSLNSIINLKSTFLKSVLNKTLTESNKIHKTITKKESQREGRKYLSQERLIWPRESLQELISIVFQDLFIHLDKVDLKEEIREKILEHRKKLWDIDEKIKEITGFRITVPFVLLACDKCKNILSPKEISENRCLVCNEPLNIEKIEYIPIYKVPDEIKAIWNSNLWFEAYVAKMLRRLNFQTWIGVHCMGASGIMHEVDVLAIRDGTIVIAECKTGKITRNDVFNFCTKISDLKAHVSILALIKELPEPETREFIRKNRTIVMLENIGKKKEEEIFNELKQGLSLKA